MRTRSRRFIGQQLILILLVAASLSGSGLQTASAAWATQIGTFSDSGQRLGSADSIVVALGDVDGDGDLDAFIANTTGQPNTLWRNNGFGDFADSGQTLGSSNSTDVALADVDGDTDLDAFVVNGTGENEPNQVWINDGNGNFSDSGQALGASWSESVALGDVDGDGDVDAFVANFGQPNTVWRNDGNGLFSDSGQNLAHSSGINSSMAVALADVDGDGDLDAAVGNLGGTTLWLNDGSGLFSEGALLGEMDNFGVALADLDKDNDLDIFVANVNAGFNEVWLNDGDGDFSSNNQTLGSSNSEGLALGDVDGDGDVDAVVGNLDDQPNRIWLNNGSGQFSDSGQALGNGHSTGVALDDLDGDGDLDLFVVNRNQPNEVWWNGSPRNTPPEIVSDPIPDWTAHLPLTAPAAAIDPDLDDPAKSDRVTLRLLTFPDWLFLQDAGDGTGTFSGQPGRDDVGSHTVVWEARDSFGATDVQTFTLTIQPPVNGAPVAFPDQFEVDEDSADNRLDVLGNDFDLEENALTVTAAFNPEQGTVQVSPDGSAVLYTPPAGFVGVDFFEYTISDGTETATARSRVDVADVNDAPVAVDDLFAVLEEQTLSLDVLVNDRDADEGDVLFVAAVTQPAHGSVAIASDGRSLTYAPDADFSGGDSFTYTASDGRNRDAASRATADGTVTLTVINVNDPPVAVDDSATVAEDSEANPIDPTANDRDVDGDALRVTAVGPATYGSTGLDGSAVVYTPTIDFSGSDTFTYTVSDGFQQAQGRVNVIVTGSQDPPQAAFDEATVAANSVDVPLDLAANDLDVDGDPLTVSGVTDPPNGSARLADGLVYYSPDPDFVGEDIFSYTVSDGQATTDAPVVVTVLPANRAPIAETDAAAVEQDTQNVPIQVLLNDRDPEGSSLTVVAVGQSGVSGATVAVNPDGSALLYTPAPGFVGGDSFAYTVSDGERTAAATVNVTVRAAVDQADLSLARRDESVALFAGETGSVTSHFTVTNRGPAPARNVTLDLTTGANLLAASGVGAACTASGNAVACQMDDLDAGAEAVVTLYASLKPLGASLAATARATSDTPDPSDGNNGADASLAVGPARERRTVGLLTITANGFGVENGMTVAQGDVVIGSHFVLPGPNARLTFDGAGNLSGQGTLHLLLGNLPLFTGEFTATPDGKGAPSKTATSALPQAGGFPVSDARIDSFDLTSGAVTLQATLELQIGDASAQPALDLTLRPGPHWAGSTAAPFALFWGDGSVLALSGLNGDLLRQGSSYQIRATGVLSYNLWTEELGDEILEESLSLTDTADYRGQVADVSVALGADGSISERNDSLASLALSVDFATLTLNPVTLDGRGLDAPVGTWTLGAGQGAGESHSFDVRIGPDGLSLVGQRVALPDVRPDGALFVVRNASADLLAAPDGFLLADVTGDLTLDLPQNYTTIANAQIAPQVSDEARDEAQSETAEQAAAPATDPADARPRVAADLPGPTNGLIVWYKFDEEQVVMYNYRAWKKRTLLDSSGNDNHIVCERPNCYFDWTLADFGKEGTALGTSRFAMNLKTPTVIYPDNFTLSMWIQGNAFYADAYVLNHSMRFKLGVKDGNLVLEDLFDYPSGFALTAPYPNLKDWHHIAVRYAERGGEVSLWLDGKKVASANSAQQDNPYQSVNYYLGSGYDGKLDDLRLYGRLLSDAEISALAGPPSGPVDSANTFSNPIVFPFNEDHPATTWKSDRYDVAATCDRGRSLCPQVRDNGWLLFDGRDDRLRIENTPAINPTNQMAVSISIWRDTSRPRASNHTLLEKRNQYRLWIEDNRTLKWEVHLESGVKTVELALPGTQNWFAVTGSYDGANLYLKAEGETASTPGTGLIKIGDQPLLIGSNGGIAPFKGAVAELRIHHRVPAPDDFSGQLGLSASVGSDPGTLLVNFPLDRAGSFGSYSGYDVDERYNGHVPDVPGRSGEARNFWDGGDVVVSIEESDPDVKFFAMRQNSSLFFWSYLRENDLSQPAVLLRTQNGSDGQNLSVKLRTDGKLEVTWPGGSLVSDKAGAKPGWTHWGIVNSSGYLDIYRGGVLEARRNAGSWAGSRELVIQDGILDQLEVHTRAFTSNEIRLTKVTNPALPVKVAGADLSLGNPKIVGSSLQVDGFRMTLPPILGGRTVEVKESFTLKETETPIPGFPSTLGLGSGNNTFSITNAGATMKASGNGYAITIKGDISLGVPSQKDENQGVNASVTLVLDANADISGSVDSFDFSLAGFAVAAKDISVQNETVKVGEASLTLPAPLDGTGATLNDLEILPDDIKIKGGSFSLGPIKLGKMQLASIQGSLKKEGSAYEIAAKASVALPGIGGNDTCSILAGIVFSVDKSTGRRIIDIYPLDPNTVVRYVPAGSDELVVLPLRPGEAVPDWAMLDAGPQLTAVDGADARSGSLARKVRIKEAELGLENCEIPLGQTGGYLTTLKGKVTLDSGTTVIRIDVGLAYGKEIKPFGRLITADLYAELGLNVPYFYPELTRKFTFTRNKTHTGRNAGAHTVSVTSGFTDRTEYPIPLTSASGVENELAWRNDPSKGLNVPIKPFPLAIGPQGEMSSPVIKWFGHTYRIPVIRVNPDMPLPAEQTLQLPASASTGGTVRQTTTYPPQSYTALLRKEEFPSDPVLLYYNPAQFGHTDALIYQSYCLGLQGTWQRLDPPLNSNYGCVFDKGQLSIEDVYALERYRSDFTFSMGGEARAFDLFKIGQAQLSLDQVRGLDASLNATLVGKFGPVELQNFLAELSAWHDSRGFNMTGQVGLDIALTLRSITNGTIPVNKGIVLGLAAEFGKFEYNCRGYGSGRTCDYAWGLKGIMIFDIPGFIDWIPGVPDKVEIIAYAGWSTTENRFKFAFGGGAKQYQLVKRERVARALDGHHQRARGRLDDTAFHPPDPDIAFIGDPLARSAAGVAQNVLVNVPVAFNTDMLVMLEKFEGGPGMTLIAPNGTRHPLDNDALPDGIAYSQLRQHLPSGGPSVAASRGVGQVRAISAVDGVSLNVSVNGPGGSATVAGSLGFGQASGYVDLPPGSYTVSMSGSGARAATANITLAAGDSLSLVAVGAPGSLQVWPVADRLAPLATEEAQLRLLHAAPDGPTLTVKQLFGGDIFIKQRYLSVGDPVELFPQEWDMGIHRADDNDASVDEMLALESIVLQNQHLYTWLVAQDAGGELRFFLIEDSKPMRSVRLVNAGSTAGDLRINGQTVAGGVAPGTLTPDLSFPLGPLQAEINGVQASVALTISEDVTLVYTGSSLGVYTETNQIADPDYVLVRVLNLSSGPASVQVHDKAVAADLSGGGISAYATLRHRPGGVTVAVETAGGSHTFPGIVFTEGAAVTLYILENGSIQLLVGVDTGVVKHTVDYLRLEGTAVAPGAWQVELTNALGASDYSLRVEGNRPAPTLENVAVNGGGEQATVQWQYNGNEPSAGIAIRLREVDGPAQARLIDRQIRQVEMLDGWGYPVLRTVTETTELVPEYGDTFTIALLNGDGGVQWIDGSPQQHSLDLRTVPSGQYEVLVVADDQVLPPVTETAPTRLTVNHPWPDGWTANPQIVRNVYGQTVLAWDEFPTPDITEYDVVVGSLGDINATATFTVPNHTRILTLTSLLPNHQYGVSVVAHDSERERISTAESVLFTTAGADFEMQAVNPPATLTPGQPTHFDLRLTTAADPHPAVVALNVDDFSAEHLGIGFSADAITPTLAGVNVTVYLTPSTVLTAGVQPVFIFGRGGGVTRDVIIGPELLASDFALNLSSQSVAVGPAGAEIAVQATGQHGHSRAIHLDALNLPQGVTAAFDQSQIRAGESATLRLGQTAIAQRGSYTVTVRGDDGPNDESHSLRVNVLRPDFTVQPDNTHLVIDESRSSAARFRLDVALVDGWSHPVRLWVAAPGLPPGSAVSLSKQAVGGSGLVASLDGPGFVYLTVTPGVGTPLGVHLLTVYTESAGVGKAVEVSVDVQSIPTAQPIHRYYLPSVQVGLPPAPLTAPDLVITELKATPDGVALTLRNQGQIPVTDEFWVDVYIDPQRPPTGPNQLWSSLSSQGLVWGVNAGTLPLNPGLELTLIYGDPFYAADYSLFTGGLAVGTPVYAQVDSWDTRTDYGAVLEGHEKVNGLYNNVTQTTVQPDVQGAGDGSVSVGEGESDGFREEGLPERIKPGE